MSVLAFPRMYFRGNVSWDPAVSNNDPNYYDGVTARAKLAPGQTPIQFREQLIATTAQRGDWNYYGTHICRFERARIVGGALPASAADGDPLIDRPVRLAGKLVDLDPNALCSQIFFDELVVGLPGGPHLRARPLRRMSSRWLSFARNLGGLPIAGSASAAWQTVFPTADLELARPEESPLLAAFADALNRPEVRGLMLRCSTYRTLYFQNGIMNDLEPAATMDELGTLHAQGKAVSNPAYAVVVGAVGLWREGDIEAEPGGRRLVSTRRTATPRNAPNVSAALFTAAVELDAPAARLSVDFSNTFPELDITLEKVDFGDLTVVADVDGRQVPIARIPAASYDRAAYEARGGIVDVDLNTTDPAVDDVAIDKLEKAKLSVVAGTGEGAVVLLTEQQTYASARELNVYLDESDTPAVTIDARVFGRIPTEPLKVVAAEYDAAMDFTNTKVMLTPGADGSAYLQLQAERPGFRYYLLIPSTAEAPPPKFGISTAAFLGIRTLPFDDAMSTGPDDDWNIIYNQIFANYDAITPRMSNILDLGDLEAVRTFARRIIQVTDPVLFEGAHYMPVTRDLSRGKRELLHRFCLRLLNGEQPNVAPAEGRPRPATALPPGEEAAADVTPDVPYGSLPGVPAGIFFDKRARPSD